MRAVVQERYGTTGVWRVAERPVPEPGSGEVLVRVAAAALDRGTWHLMAGLPLAVRPAVGLRAPRNPVPGRDLAGEVTAHMESLEGTMGKSLGQADDPLLVSVPLVDPVVSRKVGLIRRKGRSLSPAAQQFYGFFSELKGKRTAVANPQRSPDQAA